MPSDAIQTSQLRCFWRSQNRGLRQAAITNRLLQRALNQQANYTTNPQAATPLRPTPLPTSNSALWAHTIAKIYADSGLAICKPPTANATGTPSIITSCPTVAPIAEQLHQHAITMLGDLHTGQQWMTPDHLPAALRPQLQPILQGPTQPAPDRHIHSGQFWHLSPALQQHPARTIYEINPVPGDTYSWTPVAPHSTSTNGQPICFSTIPPNTAWKKILCQPNTNIDQSGRLLRRILSITSTYQPQTANDQSTAQPPTNTLVDLIQPPPTAYTIYVDGGWDTVNADFTTAFQEQRDPTNRRGSAGIAIVPTGLDWTNKGTILITLSDGSHTGSQPAHMELVAIIIGLALRR